MSKVNLTDVGSLGNPSSARQNINLNSESIEAAFDNTLSRDGSSPNQMEADLDMNSNLVLNVADPVNDGDAVNKRSIGPLVDEYAAELIGKLTYGQTVVDVFTAFAGQTDFVLSQLPGNLNNTEVYVDGAAQRPLTDYTLTGTNNQTLVRGTASTAGQKVMVRYYKALPAGQLDASSALYQRTTQDLGTFGNVSQALSGLIPRTDGRPKSIVEFGASAAFVDNLGFIQSAINGSQRGAQLYLPEGRFNVSAVPDNSKGVVFTGPGKIVAPTPVSQINTYRYDKPIAINKEYLWRVYQVLENTNREIRCYTYGDSTVAGGLNFISWESFLQNLLPDMASARGVFNKFTVTNRGVGGSNLSTLNITPDIGVNSATPADLVILKCGINDAFPEATRLADFETRLRNQLAAVRATSGGDIGSTAILLVGPNAVWDMEFDSRNTRWFEQLRSIFEAAARDYKCAYFDAYAYLQDASFAAGRWLDVPASGPQTGLHPTNVGQLWIWGGVMNFIFGDMETLRWKSNQFHNRSQFRGFPTAKNPPDYYPSNYPPGITMEIALAADGFPITGYLKTDKHVDGYLVQTLVPVDGSFALYMRTARTSDNFYTAWQGTKAALTLGFNGWTNFGGVYRTGVCQKGLDGTVSLSGMLAPGTLAINTKIAELPPGYRPVNQHIMRAASANSGGVITDALIEILADGSILLKQYTGTPSYISLSGLQFII